VIFGYVISDSFLIKSAQKWRFYLFYFRFVIILKINYDYFGILFGHLQAYFVAYFFDFSYKIEQFFFRYTD